MRAGDFVILSGQLGIDDGALVAGGVAAQTTRAMENVSHLLGSAGASLNDIVTTTCYLIDMDDFGTFNAAYAAALGDHRPTRSTVAVRALPLGASVEIEAWAYLPR